jgi:hypothetical protein
MEMLKTTFAIDRISISAIAERRTFVLDRFEQHTLHQLVYPLPFDFADLIGQSPRIDRSPMKYFRSIQISYTGD